MNDSKGLVFPLVLDGGKPEIGTGISLIKSSILIILSWFYDREFTQEFRSRLDEVTEEPNDDITLDLVRHFTVESISTWEKRIELLEVEVNRPEINSLSIHIRFYSKELSIEDTFNFNYQLN